MKMATRSIQDRVTISTLEDYVVVERMCEFPRLEKEAANVPKYHLLHLSMI